MTELVDNFPVEVTQSESSFMPKKIFKFLNLFLFLLIFVFGSVVGFQYAGGKFGKLPFLPQPNTISLQQNAKLVNTFQPENFKEIDFQQFWEVWRILENQYVDPEQIDPEQMLHSAISGLTNGVGDPYTVYLPPKDKQRTDEDLSGSFYGVGIQLGYIDETLAVIAPMEGSPAKAAGVQAGDLILHVKDEAKGLDEDTANWTINDAVSNIRGKRGTSVILTLFRKNNGSEPFNVEIKRDEIIVPSVELTLVNDDSCEFKNGQSCQLAHLKVNSFNERTKIEWDEAIKQLEKNPKFGGVILDFRNNPGGLLDMAIKMASDFFNSGVVVTQKGRYVEKPFKSNGEGRLKNYPVVVLVNRGSASASEIVAGALRDQVGAKLIGEKTFGKGTVQDRIDLANGGALHVTIAKWLLPSGEWIHHEGIPVQIEVSDNPETEQDEVVLKAVEEL